MSQMQGKVQFLNAKEWNGKTLYSFKLADQQPLFMCGTDKPELNQGDYITFEAKENARGQLQVNVKTIRAKTAEVVTPDKPWNNWQRPQGDDKRQRTIEYQAARNSAIAAADVILSHQALKLPAKEAAKYEVVMALIADLTKKFFEETATLGEVAKLPVVENSPVSPDEEAQVDAGGWDE